VNTKTILAASFSALAIGVGAPSFAATSAQDHSGAPNMMQQGQGSGQSTSMMGSATSQSAMGGGMMGMRSGKMSNEGTSHSGMMGGDTMGGGMMGMMSSCPMMMGAGLDRKTAMKMHGEMMRAMGDILIKYADKIKEPTARQ
jgi:hypothetical protein